MINRPSPHAPPTITLSQEECVILDELVKDGAKNYEEVKTLSDYIVKLAQMGGYLARRSDPPPGKT